MRKKTASGQMASEQRRNILKYAGASAAVGSFISGASRASVFGANVARNGGDVLDVAIVGAGLSGLTAARDLRRAGCESFLVLEARDRVGGRTLNYQIDGGYVSEVGGQWIGPGQTAIADLARELEVGTFPTYYKGKTVMLGGTGKVEIDLKGTFGTDGAVAASLSRLSRDVPSGAPWTSPRAADLDKLSLGDWLVKQNIEVQDREGWTGSSILSGGAAPAQMGLLHFLSMINSANCDFSQLDSIKHSAQETRFIGGSQILSIKMTHELGDRVQLSSPVRRISNWNSDVVTLHTDRGVVRARKVIMAIHPALCHQVRFDPPLPEGRAALQRAWPCHLPVRKTAMVYRRPFWRDNGLNGHVLMFNGPILWAWDNSPPGGEIGVINAFVKNGMMPAEPAEAREMHVQFYRQALGNQASFPVAFHDHDWGRADPWTITCVSPIPPGFWSEHGESLHPPCGNLIWSGTETANIWAGYMDGAVRSGHHSALQALNALRRGAA
ncbi:flavin monoamine oxidase family protein [Burkholderia multivorans]|uniref:flavin monoamine oxidase family protein n=1 Tax=Burkholderia multivorans TaxID=87883 RepID=UPI001C2304EA|nr:FAD-dependent oxidoreductase [Burkholderia multivorans]MBU9456795.1 FAD-dependent oxidoreductase [Burkholderia multivorans]